MLSKPIGWLGRKVNPLPRIAVVGCGYWGKNLVRNFEALGALALVVDATEQGRETAKQLAPNTPVSDDFKDALTGQIDGVVIATPAETHYDLVRQALTAGKDVFVEKPMALTADKGAELVRMASAKDRILMVGHVLEYHPAIVKMVELVHSGALGRLQYIYSNRVGLGKIRREENILWSFAPHDIAVILRLVGAMPFQVVACGGAYIQPNIADVTVTHLLFDNGVRAHIHISWLHPFKEQRLVVIGSEKMASYDDVAKSLVLYDHHIRMERDNPVPVKGAYESVIFDEAEPLRVECEALLQALTARTAPLTDGLSGLKVLNVLNAAQRSLMMNGQPAQVGL